MKEHRVYKHLQKRERFCGLELLDGFGVLLLFGFTQMVTSSNVKALLISLLGYSVLFFGKKGKPTGWTQTWIRFHLKRKTYRCGALRCSPK